MHISIRLLRTVFNGDIRIRDGKIIEIGELLDHLDNDQVIEAEGHFLLPGFIDAHTHLGLYDEGTGTVGNDANETIFAMTPHLRAIDGVYPPFDKSKVVGIHRIPVELCRTVFLAFGCVMHRYCCGLEGYWSGSQIC